MRQGYEKAGKAPTFSEGNETSVEIRQKNTLRELHLRLTGKITIAGGEGGGEYHEDAAHRIARILKVDYDGETRINAHGVDLATLETQFEPQATPQTFPTSLAEGSHDFDVLVRVPFYMPGLFETQSGRFALPTKLVDAPLLKVQWGNVADLTHGDTDYDTIEFEEVRVELYEVPLRGVPPAVPGQYFPLLLNTSIYRLTEDVTEEVHELPGMPGGRELRAVIASAAAHGSGDTDFRRSDDVLTKVGITVNGVEEISPVPASLIQRRNARLYNLSAVRAGVYVLDPAEDRDGQPYGVWSIRRGLRPFVQFDADHNGDNGQHQIRFLMVATDGRIAA